MRAKDFLAKGQHLRLGVSTIITMQLQPIDGIFGYATVVYAKQALTECDEFSTARSFKHVICDIFKTV